MSYKSFALDSARLRKDLGGATQPFLLEQETVFFVCASLLDLGMTIYLLSSPTQRFYESNPIACEVLFQWGILGLTVYKLFLVSLVCGIGQYIACQRVGVARGLMTLATTIVTCVVIYSALLCVGITLGSPHPASFFPNDSF